MSSLTIGVISAGWIFGAALRRLDGFIKASNGPLRKTVELGSEKAAPICSCGVQAAGILRENEQENSLLNMPLGKLQERRTHYEELGG